MLGLFGQNRSASLKNCLTKSYGFNKEKTAFFMNKIKRFGENTYCRKITTLTDNHTNKKCAAQRTF
ncbi:MAG: hypothetical protein DBY04_03225 [Clostridiales bacterium]|nr:MAG: hypothetical protein DBY04_03225 [Clostridiales bacterium]